MNEVIGNGQDGEAAIQIISELARPARIGLVDAAQQVYDHLA